MINILHEYKEKPVVHRAKHVRIQTTSISVDPDSVIKKPKMAMYSLIPKGLHGKMPR